MGDFPPQHQDTSERLNFSGLSFVKLQEAALEIGELAKTSFKLIEHEEGYDLSNINGSGINVRYREGLFKLSEASLPEFRRYIASGTPAARILQKGSPDKSSIIEAAKTMISDLNYRIID